MYFFLPPTYMYFPLLNIHFKNFFQTPSKEYALTLFNNFNIEAGLQMSMYWNNIFLTSHPQYVVGTQKNHASQ